MSDNYNESNEVEVYDSYVDGEDVFYTSGQVAAMIGISRDLVRYYTNEYEEFVKPDKTKGGHLRYRGDDIETLRLILSLLKKHSAAETKAILRDKDVKLIYANAGDEEKGILKILLENDKYLAEMIVKNLENIIEKRIMLIEDKESENYDNILGEIKKLREENKELKDKIREVSESLVEREQKKGFWGLFKKR